MPSPPEEVRHGGNNEIDAIQLPQRRAGVEQVVWQGRHELGTVSSPLGDSAPAQARGGESDECGHEGGGRRRGGLHERDRADAGVTGVALGGAVERGAQRRLPDGAGREPIQVGLPPTQLSEARRGEEDLRAPAGSAGPPAGRGPRGDHLVKGPRPDPCGGARGDPGGHDRPLEARHGSDADPWGAGEQGRDAGPDAAQRSGRDRVQLGSQIHDGAQSSEDLGRFRGADALGRVDKPSAVCNLRREICDNLETTVTYQFSAGMF